MAASDFTNVRVESIAWDTNVLRFSYGNTNDIGIYRAVHGGSFSLIQTIPHAWGGTLSPYYDEGTLSEQTYYDYKLSDDGGSTFTSIVSVQTQKRFVTTASGSGRVDLPAFVSEQDVNTSNLQQMSDQLQSIINGETIAAPRPCNVCPSNGALVLDCSSGCYRFIVDEAAAADVNSISINCESLELDFNVPSGTTLQVCGFPETSGFTGDECIQAPVSSGVNGFNIVTHEPPPCPQTRTRLTSSPCKGDYIYECYDTDSLIIDTRSSSVIRNVPIMDCGCGTTSGGITHENLATATYSVFSGRQLGLSLTDHKGYAGMSVLYKSVNSSCSGAPAAATIVDYAVEAGGNNALPLISHFGGKPIVGLCINVPVGATIRNFTGHVFLWDYPNSRYIWGHYSGADLHAGAYPTILATMNMSVITPGQVDMIIDQTAGTTYDVNAVTINTNTDTQFLGSSVVPLNAEPLGFGIIWVANNTDIGDHWATFSLWGEDALLWWV